MYYSLNNLDESDLDLLKRGELPVDVYYYSHDADKTLHTLSECVMVGTPSGMNSGYTWFDSREECITAWGLKLFAVESE